MNDHFLTALPVYNEVAFVNAVLDKVKHYSQHVLVIDDGSDDGTSALLAARDDIQLVTHAQNRGYGAALISAFQYAMSHDYNILVTIDCDGQHEPQLIPDFVKACRKTDIVSGSRYLRPFVNGDLPPVERERINRMLTAEINKRLSLDITDAFCGFKAYRVSSLKPLPLTEPGYAMPLELWVQASAAGLQVTELPVPLIYLDEKRTFGGQLDEADVRLEYYRLVLEQSIAALSHREKEALADRSWH